METFSISIQKKCSRWPFKEKNMMKIELNEKNVELIQREDWEEKLQQKLTSSPTFADPGMVERSPFQRACEVLVFQNSKEHHVESLINRLITIIILLSWYHQQTYFNPHEYLSISCSCSSIFFTRENHLERKNIFQILPCNLNTNQPTCVNVALSKARFHGMCSL